MTTLQQNLERMLAERSAELGEVNERLIRALYDYSASEATAQELERRDPVTGLWNRRGLGEQVQQALEGASRDEEAIAAITIGAPKLVQLRETFGSDMADTVASDLAVRLRGVAGAASLVGRIAEDEFVVLCFSWRAQDELSALASRLFDAADAEISLVTGALALEPAVGIATSLKDNLALDVLLRHANVAMRFALEHRTGVHQFFRSDIPVRRARRLLLETELRTALRSDEFCVHFQPRLTAKTRRVVCAEALLRWRHPQRGLLPAAEFIDVAVESGLIVPIGERVLEQASLCAAQWPTNIALAVNLSLDEFRGKSMLHAVEQTLSRSGLSPERLQFEIDEAVIGRCIDKIDAETFVNLGRLGIRLALDNFGAGSSNLWALRQLPIDSMNIDAQFVRAAPIDGNSARITSAIVRLGRQLGLKVVANGVETDAQLSVMTKFGCDQVQGYLFGEPLAAADFERLLEAQQKVRKRSSARAAAARPLRS